VFDIYLVILYLLNYLTIFIKIWSYYIDLIIFIKIWTKETFLKFRRIFEEFLTSKFCVILGQRIAFFSC